MSAQKKINSDALSSAQKSKGLSAVVSNRLLQFPGYPALLLALARCKNVYVAGGAVRDSILSRPFHDVDIFMPRSVLSDVLKRPFKIGILRHGPLGSPRWHVSGDTYFDLVAIEDIEHGFGSSKNILDVLSRFDFTGNAIAYSPFTEQILDPLGGLDDLHAGLLKAVRYDYPNTPVRARQRLTWRAVFWFRLMHYSSKLGLRIEGKTYEWLSKNVDCRDQYAEFAKLFFEPQLVNL